MHLSERSQMGGTIRIGFLHLSPKPGALVANQDRLREGVREAIDQGATWVLTPELSTSGYTFHDTLGLDWISPNPDHFAYELAAIAASRGISLFFATAEREAVSGLLYNSMLVYDGKRGFVGSHRKIATLKVGSEAWASAGSAATGVQLAGGIKVGLLVCADACLARLGAEMKGMDADILISAANWAPGEWGPAGEWEAMSASTGLPLFVCNRTGEDAVLSFSAAETVIIADGVRQLSFSSSNPSLVLVDWEFETSRMVAWSGIKLV